MNILRILRLAFGDALILLGVLLGLLTCLVGPCAIENAFSTVVWAGAFSLALIAGGVMLKKRK